MKGEKIMNLRKKIVTFILSLGLLAGMGTVAFASDNAAVNLLPYPNREEFSKVVTYNPNGNPKPVPLMVQGANVGHLPEPFSKAKASTVKFKAFDGLSAGATSTVPINNSGSNYAARSIVTLPKHLSYGAKVVNASIPGATGWNGRLDLGVIVNSKRKVVTKKVKVSFYNGTPGKPGTVRLKKSTAKNVSPDKVSSVIKYASALDAAKSEANALIIVGNGINLYVTRITVGGVTLGESTASDQRWSYRIYDSAGNVRNNSNKVGAEAAPASDNLHVVWAYGSWDVLPDYINPSFL